MIASSRFVKALEPYRDKGIAIALSGGPDSTALAHFCAEALGGWQELFLFVVDHGVRSDSTREAERVRARFAALGANVQILGLNAGILAGYDHAALRQARYQALANACRREGLGLLLTAHHQDDQIETLLERLSRGSGFLGLCGIREWRVLDANIGLYRPFLAVHKAELVYWLKARGISYENDPSNTKLDTARGVWRILRQQSRSEFSDSKLIALRQSAEALRIKLEKEVLVIFKGAKVHASGTLIIPGAKRQNSLTLCVLLRYASAVLAHTVSLPSLEDFLPQVKNQGQRGNIIWSWQGEDLFISIDSRSVHKVYGAGYKALHKKGWQSLPSCAKASLQDLPYIHRLSALYDCENNKLVVARQKNPLLKDYLGLFPLVIDAINLSLLLQSVR